MKKRDVNMVGMSNLLANRYRMRNWRGAVALAAVFLLGVWNIRAADPVVKISFRPLTPGELSVYGLTNTTQLAAGVQDVGIGQPAYLEALVTKGTVVTQMTWTLATRPTGSTAALQSSPLTNLPTYDGGDRLSFDVAGRTKLVPDVVGSTSKGDYTVVAMIMLTNKTIAVTNMVYGSSYQGMYGEADFGCELCHADKIPAFTQTAHADAFKRKINGSDGAAFKASCVSCHVLGYDTNPAATNGGFDDVALSVGWTFPTNMASPSVTNNWDAMPATLQVKANIQCENCHGPGRRHMLSGGVTNMIGISLSAGNCGQCHDKPTNHVKNYEWGQTMHALGPDAFSSRASCGGACHTTKGFIDANDPGVDFNGHIVPTRGTYNEGIACAACHDPHSKGMGDSQVRNFTNFTFTSGAIVAKGGEGVLCMRCHHDRYNANDRVNVYESSRGFGGPHYGVQGDMLFGTNAIQYGMNMPSSRHWDVVEDTCVTCHMQDTPTNGPAMNKVGGHTWMIGWSSSPTSSVELTKACLGCHGEIESFNFGGEDYDQDGVVEGVQKEVSDMLFQLASMLPPYSGTNISTTGWPTTGLTSSGPDYSKRAARYNWLAVVNDGSLGVHNPKYITAILRASIDDLKGGIDVDHDGLRDAWEIANFGNLTTANGTSDSDHDGLTDLQEMAAGTNPNNPDSDGDGLWDLAELQAGSDPLNAASAPETNQVYILPAFELGYVPQTMGVTQQFQSVSDIGTPPGWTNVGSSFVSSNAWFYRLISPRDADHKFFRVRTTP